MTVAASILNTEDFFTASLFQEFEASLDTVFGFSYSDLKTTLDRADTPERKGFSVDEELKVAFEEGGTPQLRWMMKNIVINLSYIFLSQELGRNATFEEWVSTVESFDVGIGRMDMDPSHLDGVEVIPMSNGSKVG